MAEGIDWKGTVAAVAPTIATALGGPLAGMAVSMLSKCLGVEPNEQVVRDLVTVADPDTMAKVKIAEMHFKLKLQELDVSLEDIAARDRDSARRRETILRDYTPTILAWMIIVGYLATNYYIMTGSYSEGAKELILRSLGALDAAVATVLGYYFGYSAHSNKRT